ncbi:manganese catalase family protein, partial [Salmonella enterica subsp. enterica serovar Kentucky]|nr:manganese catalase family protein [Salmonella enterica subsp. enterica serovar Kentucky]
ALAVVKFHSNAPPVGLFQTVRVPFPDLSFVLFKRYKRSLNSGSGGVPWTAAYIDTIGEVTADLRSNIAAEARAKIIYERLINLT